MGVAVSQFISSFNSVEGVTLELNSTAEAKLTSR